MIIIQSRVIQKEDSDTMKLSALAITSCLLIQSAAFAAPPPPPPSPTVITGGVRQTVTEHGIVGLDMRILPEGVSYPLVQRVFKNTPASLHGMQPGDYIMEIDNETTIGKSVTDIDAMISDIPGTPVLFTLLRAGRILRIQLNVAPASSVGYKLGNN